MARVNVAESRPLMETRADIPGTPGQIAKSPGLRRRGTAGRRRGLPGDLGERPEARRIAHRDVGQRLAIERDARHLQAADELAVRQLELLARGPDAHDPEAPELALARAPVAVRIGERMLDLLARDPVIRALGKEVALGPLEDLLPLQAPLVASFDSWHRSSPNRLRVRQQLVDALEVAVAHQDLPVERALPRRGFLRQDVPLVGLAALDLPGRRDPEALGGPAVCLDLRHLLLLAFFLSLRSRRALHLLRSDDHVHQRTFLARRDLVEARLQKLLAQTIQDPEPDVLVEVLAAPEDDRRLDLVAFRQEPRDVLQLELEIVFVRLRAELDL